MRYPLHLWGAAGIVIFGAIFLFRKGERDVLPNQTTVVESKAAFKEEGRTTQVPPRNEPALTAPGNDTARSVAETIDALQELSARSDAESLQQIVSNLENQNPEIRSAALEAVVHFGSRDAIPILKTLSAKTGDPREKVEILDAIEYLELPSLTEIRPPRGTNTPTP